MALKAGLVFLVAYAGLFVAIVLPAIASEARGNHPGPLALNPRGSELGNTP
jgi:hypothetical protein